MKKRNISGLAIALFALLFFSACEYDTIETEKIPPEQTISFSQDIQPIFTKNCLDCHGGTTEPDLRAENAYSSLIDEYINTENPQESKLYIILQQGSHQSRTTAGEKELILTWIQRGALND
ncbi:MAG: hypothetical protein ACEPOZ_16940 [Marinifilaceae bacterium]